MKRVIIGHRGTGKTSLLQRHQIYFPDLQHFDLDQLIEAELSQSISTFFSEKGEAAFREIEKDIFMKLVQKQPQCVIAAGGGFDVSLIPKDTEVLFVSRVSDADGRLFVNRPRLRQDLSALEESQLKYLERQDLFLKRCDKIYHMPEGLENANVIEENILRSSFTIADAIYTLIEKDIPLLSQIVNNYKNIELRTDLLSDKMIQKILSDNPNTHWLVSIRTQTNLSIPEHIQVDRDVRFEYSRHNIVSSHADSIGQAIAQLKPFENTNTHLKLSPYIESFHDLRQGFDWQQQFPKLRSFLPRSRTGQWQWYRLLCKYIQRLNYIKGHFSVPDQPTAYMWLGLPSQQPESWAAVLGSPVLFSRSPEQHRAFFKQRNSFFTAINLTEEELSENILFLIQLGLKHAAVTSPLKKKLFEISDIQSQLAQEFTSANTLLVKNNQLCVDNTDYLGFMDLMRQESSDGLAVWGGGGTLDMMRKALPEAHFFSSQTGEPRDPSKSLLKRYKALIWAAPRALATKVPPETLEFEKVIDLNYRENSMGLEIAVQRQIGYISGLEMFKAQALQQQHYWVQNEDVYERK